VCSRISDGTIFVTGNKSKGKGLRVNTIKAYGEVEVLRHSLL
jgi:hypothetical protein